MASFVDKETRNREVWLSEAEFTYVNYASAKSADSRDYILAVCDVCIT